MSLSSPAMRLAVAGVVSAIIASAGCGDADAPSNVNAGSPPPAPVVDCDRGGTGELAEEARERGITAGPLLFAYARGLADHPEIVRPEEEKLRELLDDPDLPERVRRRARRTLRALPENGHGIAALAVVVEAGATVTVALAQRERDKAALVYTREAADRERTGAAGVLQISDGDAAVTFQACADRATHWGGGVLVAGQPRCLPINVWVPGRREPLRRQLPIGTGEQCPQPATAAKVLRREPYMGVACPEPNSIACDRIGLAVWLKRPAERVAATIAGQELSLRATGRAEEPGTSWQGFLQPAGLLDGPLKVTPDRGRYSWRGEHPVHARVRITIERAGGTIETTSIRQRLAAGWG